MKKAILFYESETDGLGSVRNSNKEFLTKKEGIKMARGMGFSPLEIQSAILGIADFTYISDITKNYESTHKGIRNIIMRYEDARYKAGGYDDNPVYRFNSTEFAIKFF